ncbi:FMN-linked oxidoreductase [Auricularia subglabra TFB-10046 SS5]|uniref:FMN-linked oxidoreductase n=1 Tax=Auricularia subglabra (strain TFB-10046 / SS5) TaxID=717982 RepID=J0LKU3_AURST|nr:FMN-linked oxidoreductase [Auricularia subglabra TFB-10046 SS5]
MPVPFIPYSSIQNLTEDTTLAEQYCRRSSKSLVLLSCTTAALLVVAFIKHATRDLSPYHTIVLLNLTWIVWTSAFCRATMIHRLQLAGTPNSEVQRLAAVIRTFNQTHDDQHRPSLRGFLSGRSARRLATVYYLHIGVLGWHLVASGVLGWLLFRDIDGFAREAECPGSTVIWMFGSLVRITDPTIQQFWYGTYIVAALSPICILLLCFVLGLILFLGLSLVRVTTAILVMLFRLVVHRRRHFKLLPAQWGRAFDVLCLALLALLIMSTEETIAGNPVERSEDAWGFGQMLALFLAVFPSYDAAKDLRMSLQLREASKRITQLWHLSCSLTLRGVTFKNRVLVCPVAGPDYVNGQATVQHLVQIARIAAGEPGGILIADVAVAPSEGRDTKRAGLWEDAQIEPLRRIVGIAHELGTKVGVQLTHAGCKYTEIQEEDGEESRRHRWLDLAYASSDSYFGIEDLPEDIRRIHDAFLDAIQRCETIGFDFVEIQAAGASLLHSFLSPASNKRVDAYGGNLKNRMRLIEQVVHVLRDNWYKPLFVHIATVDYPHWTGGASAARTGVQNHWDAGDSMTLIEQLSNIGVDGVICSSGPKRYVLLPG